MIKKEDSELDSLKVYIKTHLGEIWSETISIYVPVFN